MKMKRFSLVVVAALIGSALTIGAFYAFGPLDSEPVKIKHVTEIPTKNTSLGDPDNVRDVPMDFTSIAKNAMDAVVHIRAKQTVKTAGKSPYQELPDVFKYFFGPGMPQNQQQMPPQVRMGSGSGVIINQEGYIVTNNHVVANADELEVILTDNRNYQAKVIGVDPSTDLALIQIKEEDLPTIPLVNSDNIEIGEWVVAIGNPFNLNSTITAGIVSAKGRNINILKGQAAIESFIQTDAAINPGNSGGALLNMQGGLVGINTAIASPTGAYSGYGFAVPSNIVNKVVEDLLEYGAVQRGYLGVMIRSLTGQFAEEKDIDVTEGVYIDSVMAESAAAKAGIREGDVVTKVDGEEVVKSSELQEKIARKRPGDEVNITLIRNGKTQQYEVVLQSREGRTEIVSRESGEALAMLGAEFKTLPGDIASELEIDGGVKVTKLHAGKLRRQTDIKEGFIITRINGQKVTSAEELNKKLHNIKGGVMLEGVYEDIPGVYYYAFGM